MLEDISYQGGYAVLFFWILANRAGVPLPATPALLGAGVLAGAGDMRMSLILLLATCATLASDSFWFVLGRKYGHRMLNLLCRLAVDPEACARRAEDFLHRHGVRSLLVTKFIPGMNRTLLPLTGVAKTRFSRFLMWDTAGSMIWIGVYAGLGYVFSEEIQSAAHELLRRGGQAAIALVVLVVLGFLGLRIYNRHKQLWEVLFLISAGELNQRLNNGDQVHVIDLRDDAEFAPDPRTIPGAVRVDPSEAVEYCARFPKDMEVVLYCSCPRGTTSTRVAHELKRAGYLKVRPLAGGWGSWCAAGFPTSADATVGGTAAD